MKIFDCFMYFDEEIVLDLRLNILDKYVDFFVIVESKYFHNGKERQLKFDIKKYKPYVISIEYLDLNMKKLEFKNNDINNILNSNLYKYFIQNDYYFVNWLHGDLIFIHKDFRD